MSTLPPSDTSESKCETAVLKGLAKRYRLPAWCILAEQTHEARQKYQPSWADVANSERMELYGKSTKATADSYRTALEYARTFDLGDTDTSSLDAVYEQVGKQADEA